MSWVLAVLFRVRLPWRRLLRAMKGGRFRLGGPRVAPRRITTDLAEDLYAYLRRFAQDREAAADVVRVLIR